MSNIFNERARARASVWGRVWKGGQGYHKMALLLLLLLLPADNVHKGSQEMDVLARFDDRLQEVKRAKREGMALALNNAMEPVRALISDLVDKNEELQRQYRDEDKDETTVSLRTPSLLRCRWSRWWTTCYFYRLDRVCGNANSYWPGIFRCLTRTRTTTNDNVDREIAT
ncbi:hypothetical protein FALBO_15290 [Fusarium albosuccineum]|uniref:Uncharacterized protein n=1 Tax=Fusarium albosuccineum TaxID=1237068 RepID=A0A8H4KT38_9HYPO|nr:hypothetical protein FALBO_15290 [Fusarium albosuccineum]